MCARALKAHPGMLCLCWCDAEIFLNIEGIYDLHHKLYCDLKKIRDDGMTQAYTHR